MKRNPAMRAASVLLVGTLLSTSMVSGTFAKYVTQNDAQDTARVAKWGVLIQASGSLFGQEYSGAEKGNTPVVYDAEDDLGYSTVKIEAADKSNKLLAPGTKNDNGLGISLTGTPEVDTKITATIQAQNIFLKSGYDYLTLVKADTIKTKEDLRQARASGETLYYKGNDGGFTGITEYDDFEEGTDYYTVVDSLYQKDLATDYYPVIYSCTSKADGTYSSDSLKAIAETYAAKLSGKTPDDPMEDETTMTYTYEVEGTTYNALTDLGAKIGLSGEALTWEWAFERKNDEGNVIDAYDKADTILGNLMTLDANGKINGKDAYIVTAGSDDEDFGDYWYPLVKDENGIVHYLQASGKPGKTVVACLKTSFSVSITATQVD